MYRLSVWRCGSERDLREHPEKYRIGRGEQRVFHAESYKGELLPLWRFKDEGAARESSEAINKKYLEHRSEGNFAGMDVARKYLQMGDEEFTVREVQGRRQESSQRGPRPGEEQGRRGRS
jgi:hypothetical protein